MEKIEDKCSGHRIRDEGQGFMDLWKETGRDLSIRNKGRWERIEKVKSETTTGL